jgi:carbamoyl-phosphate synthase small subunit
MTGYQEILTDPSYKGQIVVMTYPEIGNYGVNREDIESHKPWVEGFVVRECSQIVSNWRGHQDLEQYLREHGVLGVTELDTRSLTRHIRDKGALRGVLSTMDSDESSLAERAAASPSMGGLDLVKDVTCEEPYDWTEGTSKRWITQHLPRGGEGSRKVIVYDFGVKRNSLRRLVDLGCTVKVVPATTSAEEVLALSPSGVLLSNGPGDPAAVTYAIQNARELLGKVPLFGICLGHQIMALAFGGQTYKLKFGHHGGNHPVKFLPTGRVEITSQNHGFAVDMSTLPDDVELTHLNLNDQTVEGYQHRTLPAFSVQYHPEASPGPHDADYLFGRFVRMMDEWRDA